MADARREMSDSDNDTLETVKELFRYNCDIALNNHMSLKNRDEEHSSVVLEGLEELNGNLLNFFSKIFVDTSRYRMDYSYNQHMLAIQGIKYEIDIYKTVVYEILKRKMSPNFVDGLASCSFKMSQLPPKLQETIQRKTEYQKLRDELGHDLPIGILLTKKAGLDLTDRRLMSLHEWYSILRGDYYNYDKNLNNIFFQIIYSLLVMAEFKLMHNDLHSENVLVQELEEPVDLYYVYHDRTYLIRTRYVPFIYDWDFGYIDVLGNNPKIEDLCPDMLICNGFDERRDLYTLMCTSQYPGRFYDFYKNYLTNKMTGFDQSGIHFKQPIRINNITASKLLLFKEYTHMDNERYLFTLSNTEIDNLFNMEDGSENPDIDYIKELDSVSFYISPSLLEYSEIENYRGNPHLHYQFWTNIERYENGYRDKMPTPEIDEIARHVGLTVRTSSYKYSEDYSREKQRRYSKPGQVYIQEKEHKLNLDFIRIYNSIKKRRYSISLYQGFICRASGYDKTVPTPFMLMNSDMFDSLLHRGAIPRTEYAYTFPTQNEVLNIKQSIVSTEYDNSSTQRT